MESKVKVEEKLEKEKVTSQKTALQSLPSDTHLMIVSDCADGVGDFEHWKAYILDQKQKNPHLKIVGILGVWATNVPLCRKAMQFIESHRKLFAELLVSVNENEETLVGMDESGQPKYLRYQDLDKSYKNDLKNKLIDPFHKQDPFDVLQSLKSVVHIINLSAGIEFAADKGIQVWIYEKFQENPQILSNISEYGQEVSSENHAMGFGRDQLGIRLVKEWEGPIDAEKRINALLSIKNKAFVQALLGSENPDSKVASEYLKTRKFFPGYLQGEPQLAVFILTQIAASEPNECLDFFVNDSFLDPKALDELLKSMGIKNDDYMVVDDKNLHTPSKHRIRIFTSKISLDDEDYRKVFYFAEQVAAASGDDSITTVLSSSNLPFYVNLSHPIKQNFIQQMIALMKNLKCVQVANYLDKLTKMVERWYVFGMPAQFKLNSKQGRKEYPYILKIAKDLAGIQKAMSGICQQELSKFRAYLFKSCNVFSKVDNILNMAASEFIVKQQQKPEASIATKDKQVASLGTLPQFQAKISQNNKEVALSTLRKLLLLEDATTDWKFSPEQNCFWLGGIKEEDKEKYNQRILDAGMKDFVHVRKAKKGDYCLICSEDNFKAFQKAEASQDTEALKPAKA